MYYHNNGIKQYISINDTMENMLAKLTMKVFEVEDGHTNTILPDLVVIGYVKSVEQHPNADKLKKCIVDCGSHGEYQICTGGENIRANVFVPVAVPGCYLPAINLLIEPRTMRGEKSNGMICSKEELGIPEDMDQHRIWILNDDSLDVDTTHIGQSMKIVFPWLEDSAFEVKNIAITTRPDLTGSWGVACELHAVYHDSGLIGFNSVSKCIEDITYCNVHDVLHNATTGTKKIHIDTDLCATYTLLELNNLSVRSSDLYMRTMIYGTKGSPKNNWVDRSNHFMNQTGQPIHCFDTAKIIGNIIVRTAEDDEIFVDLMGQEHSLSNGDIVICDDEKIIALAGIIGGGNSCIDEQTTAICIEVAHFDATQVRKTATRLGLRTDAVMRFEKNINPHWSEYCATIILEDIALHKKTLGSCSFIGLCHAHTELPQRHSVQISVSRLQHLIWGNNRDYYFETEKIQQLLQNLGFTISIQGDTLLCISPIWRSITDITHEQDVYEEVVRLIGYENIHTEPYVSTPTPQLSPIPAEVKRIENKLVMQHGFDQVETYLWTDQAMLQLFDQVFDDNYTLLNPLSPEQTMIRPMLYPGLIQAVVKNHRFHETITIFETAHVMSHGTEDHHVCFVSYTPKTKQALDDAIIQQKQILEDLIGSYHITDTQHSYLHPNKQGEIILNGQLVGMMGEVHPMVLDELGLDTNYQLIVTEYSLTKALEHHIAHIPGGYLTNQHHIITRDVSFGLTGTATYEQILDIARSAKGVNQVEVFDLYQPGPELKTIGVRFTMVYDEAPNTEVVTKKIDYITQQIAQVEGVSVR